MMSPPVKGRGPTRIILQFSTFEMGSVAVNKPLNTGTKASAVFFEDAIGMEFVTIQLSSGSSADRNDSLRGER